jgi:hypothetical protein
MTQSYNKLPSEWKRLILVGYLCALVWVLSDTWDNQIGDKAFVLCLVSLEYWITMFLITWIVDGFR